MTTPTIDRLEHALRHKFEFEQRYPDKSLPESVQRGIDEAWGALTKKCPPLHTRPWWENRAIVASVASAMSVLLGIIGFHLDPDTLIPAISAVATLSASVFAIVSTVKRDTSVDRHRVLPRRKRKTAEPVRLG